MIDAAPGALDTLKELAEALGNDSNFSVTVTNAIAEKLAIADFNSTFDARYALTSITSAAPYTGAYSANNNKITDLSTPTSDNDAANKKYVDDNIGALNLTQIITSSGLNKVVVSDDNDNTVFTNNNMVTMTLDNVSLRPEVPINMNN